MPKEGYSSMFAWCTGHLGMAEGDAYRRIRVARLTRRFPAFLEPLRTGALHLTGASLLAPLLKAGSQVDPDALLAEAVGKTKRDIERLVASHAPKPPVKSSVRRLPRRETRPDATEATDAGAPAQETPASSGLSEPAELSPVRVASTAPPAPTPAPAMPAVTLPPRRREVRPLSESTYELRFTVSAETLAKLEHVQDLLGRRRPADQLAEVFDQALDLLFDKVLTRRVGSAAVSGKEPKKTGSEPQAAGEKTGEKTGEKSRSRYIPKAVRVAVYLRDQGRCTFVGPGGRRCGERRFVEFHHTQPYARGGAHHADTLSLRCAAHNALHARDDFGSRQIDAAIARRHQTSPASASR